MSLKSRVRLFARKNKYLHSFLRKMNISLNFIVTLPKNIILCKKYVKLINKIHNNNPIIWFINVPIHPNLGDQAMSLGIRNWVKEYYPNMQLFEIERIVINWNLFGFIRKWKKTINSNDIIVIQSGYTSSDKTPNERVHRKVVLEFPQNRIVFFPQTARYDDIEHLKKTARIYNNHKRLLFLVRDKVSYKQISQHFDNSKILLYPDIVTTFIGNKTEKFSGDKKGVLLCFREDSEKNYDHKFIRLLENFISSKYDITKQNLFLPGLKLNKEQYSKVINETFNLFSKNKVIITDRFHGVIFSMVGNSKVIAIDSIDYKVREGALMMKEFFENSSFYATSFDDIVNLLDEIYNLPDYELDDRINEKYYSKLKDIIEKL